MGEPTTMPRGVSPGRRPAATIRKPGDLTERRTSPTCADRMGGLRRRGPLRQAGNAAGGTMRRLVVASAILATLLTMPLAGVAAAPNALPATAPTDSERATAALSYLWAAQRPDGSLDKSLGETADFVIGAAAAGYDPATLQGCAGTATALDYLATASDAAAGDAAKTGKTVLAVVAAGGNPASFAGRDLKKRLNVLYHSATGAFGDGSTFGQSFAVLAVVASGGAVPAAALAELKALQDPDGSWSYGTAPVAAGDGDTNSTAIAQMALDASGVHSADAAALAYLHTQQLTDGGL